MNLFNLFRTKPRNKILEEPRKLFLKNFIQQLLVGLITAGFGFVSFYAAMNFFEIVTAISTLIESMAYGLGIQMILPFLY
ncbi:MAG: hypothetical protein ACLFPE_11920 [Bacteroidales bacterium]